MTENLNPGVLIPQRPLVSLSWVYTGTAWEVPTALGLGKAAHVSTRAQVSGAREEKLFIGGFESRQECASQLSGSGMTAEQLSRPPLGPR